MNHYFISLDDNISTCFIGGDGSLSSIMMNASYVYQFETCYGRIGKKEIVHELYSNERKSPNVSYYYGFVGGGCYDNREPELYVIAGNHKNMLSSKKDSLLTSINQSRGVYKTCYILICDFVSAIIHTLEIITHRSPSDITLFLPDHFDTSLKNKVCNTLSCRWRSNCRGFCLTNALCSYYLNMSKEEFGSALCCNCSEKELVFTFFNGSLSNPSSPWYFRFPLLGRDKIVDKYLSFFWKFIECPGITRSMWEHYIKDILLNNLNANAVPLPITTSSCRVILIPSKYFLTLLSPVIQYMVRCLKDAIYSVLKKEEFVETIILGGSCGTCPIYTQIFTHHFSSSRILVNSDFRVLGQYQYFHSKLVNLPELQNCYSPISYETFNREYQNENEKVELKEKTLTKRISEIFQQYNQQKDALLSTEVHFQPVTPSSQNLFIPPVDVMESEEVRQFVGVSTKELPDKSSLSLPPPDSKPATVQLPSFLSNVMSPLNTKSPVSGVPSTKLPMSNTLSVKPSPTPPAVMSSSVPNTLSVKSPSVPNAILTKSLSSPIPPTVKPSPNTPKSPATVEIPAFLTNKRTTPKSSPLPPASSNPATVTIPTIFQNPSPAKNELILPPKGSQPATVTFPSLFQKPQETTKHDNHLLSVTLKPSLMSKKRANTSPPGPTKRTKPELSVQQVWSLLNYSSPYLAVHFTEDKTPNHLYADGSKYTGSFVKGCRDGRGVLEYPNGTTFKGTFLNNLREGRGQLFLGEILLFSGEFNNDLPVEGLVTLAGEIFLIQPLEEDEHRASSFQIIDHFAYQGSLDNNAMNGYGCVVSKDNQLVLQGNFVNNIPEGIAVLYFPMNLSAIVHFCEGELSGNAIFLKGEEDFGRGIFSCGQLTGKGVRFNWKTKELVIGRFINGRCHGDCTVYENMQLVFIGKYAEDRKEGYGKEYDGNVVIYEGEYHYGKKHGKGKWKLPNGFTYTGEFENGAMHGYGTLVDKNSVHLYRGRFLNNTYSNGTPVFCYCLFSTKMRIGHKLKLPPLDPLRRFHLECSRKHCKHQLLRILHLVFLETMYYYPF